MAQKKEKGSGDEGMIEMSNEGTEEHRSSSLFQFDFVEIAHYNRLRKNYSDMGAIVELELKCMLPNSATPIIC